MPIDIGSDGIRRTSSVSSQVTRINLINPANDTGIITTVELFVAWDMTGLRVGTFYLVSGTTYKCRDSAELGDFLETEGDGPTYINKDIYDDDLAIEVEEGDLIGCYYASGQLENDDSGGEDKLVGGEHIDPGDEASYTIGATKILSLGGTGERAGWIGKISGVTNPAKIMGVDVANIAKVKGVA